jgi:predicted DNA-binding protein with PD1-like motif
MPSRSRTSTPEAGAARFHALRLTPGTDLRRGIEAAFAKTGARAGFVAAVVGSLTEAALRHAGRDEGATVPGPLEIVALSGTLGAGGVHLHLAVSDTEGTVTGGHLLLGSPVRTTAELVLGLLPGLVFERPLDLGTGHRELSIRPARPR